eukprot:scaffold22131_cov100-Isochrysis_galbana.AAC.3
MSPAAPPLMAQRHPSGAAPRRLPASPDAADARQRCPSAPPTWRPPPTARRRAAGSARASSARHSDVSPEELR